MQFLYRLCEHLPRLAWLAEVDLAGDILVFHGRDVETAGQYFVEGAWNGRFAEGAFAATECFFGSGATLNALHPTFVSSACTTDYLYYRESGARLLVSNSLPFLLAQSNDSLDPHCASYHLINDSIRAGIREYIRELPTRDGVIRRLMYKNLEVRRDGFAETDKPEPPPFPDYAAYRTYLGDNYGSIARNVRASERRRQWRIVSTQSRGYDTTAANAIAAASGIDAIFTITKGKAPGYYADEDAGRQTDDDGTEICRTLGLDNILAIDRRAFETHWQQEYLFSAALDSPQDENLLGIGALLEGPSLLLTGTLGEIWYPRSPYYDEHPWLSGPDLRRADLGMHALTEFRLESGFVQLPFPYLGARRRDDIDRITGSDDMLPWHVPGSYNRPIPRRIAEEAGVPRHMFGQRKIATVVEFPNPGVPHGAELRRAFRDFLIGNGILPWWKWQLLPFIRRINRVVHMTGRHKTLYYLERVVSRLIQRREFRFPELWTQLNGRIFCFCANKQVERYREALDRIRPE